jgi:hypothetical protein
MQDFYDPDAEDRFAKGETSPTTVANELASPMPRKLNERSYLVMMATIATIGSGISIILSLILLVCFNGITKGVMAAYVVDNQGNRLRVNQIDDPKQQQQHIQDYATWIARSLCTYRWYLPNDDGSKKPDPGFLLGRSGKRVPTAVYIGSLGLEPHFAAEYLPIIADQLAAVGIPASSQVESEFIPQKASVPEPVGAGKWKMRVTGVQKTRSASGDEQLIPAIYESIVREVPAISQTFAERDYREKGLAQALADARSWGLETIYITNLIKTTTKGTTSEQPRQR